MQEHSELYEHHARAKASPAELDLLHQHEPHIEFTEVETPGVSQGRQSRVSVLEYDVKAEKHRVIWKRMGAGKGLSAPEAEEMNARLTPYRLALADFGWTLPKLFHHRVSKINGETQIFSYEEFIPGGDGESMVADDLVPQFRKWHMISETLQVLFRYPEQLTTTELGGKQLHRLPVGLDLKLANVVLSATNDELFFVDLFGPKEIDEEGKWLIYNNKLDPLPHDNLLAVCGTREGAALRFWRLARKTWFPTEEKERRPELDREFLEHLSLLSPPQDELELIRDEVEAGYPWMDKLYKEHHI
jgi:hypothetical protein